MRWVWALLRGVLIGLVTSVLPSELWFLFVPIALVAIPLIRAAWRRVAIDKLADFGIPFFGMVSTVAVCIALPYKYIDRNRVELNSDCVTVEQLASLVHARNSTPEAAQTKVCFAERAPTLRTVENELRRQANTSFQIGYCGTGATFLFGAHPLHREFVAVK